MIQEIIQKEAQKWVFDDNGHKWSNNDDSAGDNSESFKAGAKFMLEHMEKCMVWASVKGWRFNAFRNHWEKQVYAADSPFITTHQLIEKYFESPVKVNI